MSHRIRDHGLSIAMFSLFLVFLAGQSLAGWAHHNEDLRDHGRPEVAWTQYVQAGHFLEATFENWESEFLQMAAFIFLSALLVQRGAAESKKPPEEEAEEKRHPKPIPPDAPWPVHRGGLALALYERSLSIALALLFVVSFALHAVTGLRNRNEDAALHGQPTESLGQYLGSSTFWYESFQNWQSEFLSVGVLVVLSIFLRQRDSPESKSVAAPHSQTGNE